VQSWMMKTSRSWWGNEWAKATWPAYGMAEDYSVDLPKINVPVKIVAGGLDRVEGVDRVRAEVLQRIEGASLVVIEDSGNMLPLEKPERLVEEIKAFCNSLRVCE